MINTLHKAATVCAAFCCLQLFPQAVPGGTSTVSSEGKKKTNTGTTYSIPEEEIPAEEKKETRETALLKKAGKYFDRRSFAEAIPFYEKVLTTDSMNTEALEKLGDCYRMINDLPGKLMCYGRLAKGGSVRSIYNLYYGQALVENGEFDKAKPYLEKYTDDGRGKALAASFGKTVSYAKNADAYALTFASFNSPQNDICAVKFYSAIVFASTRPKHAWINKNQGWTDAGFMEIYATEKDQKGLEKKPVKFMKELSTKFNDGPVCFNKDFYLMYYTINNARKDDRARDGEYKLCILEGELDENGLSMVKRPSFFNKEYNFAHPSISGDGKTLYFSSDMEGGLGGMDIYRSEKDSTNDWGPAINMGSLVNTAGNEVFPFIAPNGAFYFSSNGHPGMGGLDIYEAKLKNKEPVRIYNMGEPVNSRYDDFGIYIAEDLVNGFVTSNRKNGGMDDDIYVLQMLREVKRGKDVTIATTDKENGQPITNAKLLVGRDTVFTNEKGEYQLMLDEEEVLKIKTLKEDYFEVKDTLSARSTTAQAFTKVIALEKNPKLFLRALITDAKTQSLVPGVTIRLTDINTGKEIDRFTTTESGDYFKFLFNSRVGDKLNYLVKLEKTGYLTRTLVFSHAITKPGEVNMNESVNMGLGKIEVGMDLAKLIDLKPIYFDMASAVIRPEAGLELDRIVEVMNEYPNMCIELGSHTDCRNSATANMKLSTERAKASMDYIVKRGINKLRITSRGYGETKLLNNCFCEGDMTSDCPEEEHAKNRRTEFLITRLN